jgi:hypothetical protein
MIKNKGRSTNRLKNIPMNEENNTSSAVFSNLIAQSKTARRKPSRGKNKQNMRKTHFIEFANFGFRNFEIFLG